MTRLGFSITRHSTGRFRTFGACTGCVGLHGTYGDEQRGKWSTAGFSGDTVSGRIHVSEEGTLTVQGCGPLADLDLPGRLDAREVIDAVKHLVTRQAEHPLPGPASTARAGS